MSIADASIRNKTTTLVLTVLLVVGGYAAYNSLGRLEDPEFSIKDAKVVISYPGATAREVEEEVTDAMETAVQQLGQLKEMESTSRPGLAIITPTMKDKYDKLALPQVWDELRRKVGDAKGQLPPGTGEPQVNDDFGDVFGIFFAITGDGFSYAELEDYAQMLQRELLLCTDVAKVSMMGIRQEVIYVEISRESIAQLGVSEDQIYRLLRGKNLVTPSGQVTVGREYLRILPTGELDSVKEIGSLVLTTPFSEETIRLKDVATITRGYEDPASDTVHFNGKPAIAMGVSGVGGGNVVIMGESVRKRLAELDEETPLGIERTDIYFQPELVTMAVSGFVISLIEAVAIVIGVLLIFMGLRSGLLIGVILILTICGTLILMQMGGVSMERISLGALIIALGMLVDNAIVVTDGILIGMAQGKKGTAVAGEVVKKTMMPLLGATVVAILAFAAIGTSQDKTGEYCRSLFQVILYSLGLSWVLAVTVTPLLCVMFLKPGKLKEGEEAADPYGGGFYRWYRGFLAGRLRQRWLTLGAMVGLLVLALGGFAFVNKSFFPDSTAPQFTVDYWTVEGTDVRQTEANLSRIEQFVLEQEGVESVFTTVGQGAMRFMLTYTPENPNPAYGQLIVKVTEYDRMAELMPEIEKWIQAEFPEALTFAKPFVVGPGGGSDVEARFLGPDTEVLRQLSARAQKILRADPDARDVRDDWRGKVKVLRPRLVEPQAGNAGISRAQVATALQRNFGGRRVGVYREGDELIPIMARAPAEERLDIDNIKDMRIWSPVARASIPLRQVVSSFQTEWEDNIIIRRDRRRTITAQANAATGPSTRFFARVRPQIEAMELPPGYTLDWGGEYENSTDAQTSLGAMLPIMLLLMVLIVIILFNALKQPAIIWLTVPLAMIGVTAGLLATGSSFGFMAILGLLSLIGMLIKNAVVLVDEIDLQIREGKERFQAVLDSAVSRMRPVSMAAVTTVLGMIPLLPDIFFSAMAVTIMAGLSFATVLTLIVVPVLYVTIFRIPSREPEDA